MYEYTLIGYKNYLKNKVTWMGYENYPKILVIVTYKDNDITGYTCLRPVATKKGDLDEFDKKCQCTAVW